MTKTYTYVLVKQIEKDGRVYEKTIGQFLRSDKAVDAIKCACQSDETGYYSYAIKLVPYKHDKIRGWK